MGGTRRRRPITDPSLAVGYVRLSKDENGSLSPVVQREQLRRWAEGRGKRLVAIHEDIGVSGTRPAELRQGLVGALTELRTAAAGTLVAVHRDRLARDLLVAVQIEQLVRELGARLVTIDGTGESDSPEDQFRRQLQDLLAGHERLRTTVRTREALAMRRRQGLATGPHAPYGWRRDGQRLVIDEPERHAAARAAELLREGLSLRIIGRMLRQEGFQPRGRAWHAEAVRRLLEVVELDQEVVR